jgi:acyl-CoA synthetase (AMP-forming)/AMP-acid ligase II
MNHSIVEALARHAAEQPDRTCVIDGAGRLTYGELWAAARGFAAHLKRAGLKKGDACVMRAEQTRAFAVCHMATHLAGGIFTPVEKRAPAERLRSILRQTGARILVSTADADHPGRIDSRLALSPIAPEDFPLPQPGDPAELLFTTGTTGAAKGVLCGHRSVAAVAENLVQGMGYRPDTLIAVPGPVSHANAIRKLSSTFLAGSAILLLDGMNDLAAFFRALDEHPVTALCLPPSAIRMLLALSGKRLARYADRIDFVESGTAPLTEADKGRMRRLLPHSRLYNSYGTSEAGSCCMYDYNHTPGGAGAIGFPAVNARFEIVDEARRPIDSSPERTGLIAISGDMTMIGYWRDPALTAETLADGRLYTSDIGYFGADGMVYVVARQGDVINVAGRKVAPDAVEQAALQLDDVADCGCARAADPLTGEAPVLYVVMKPGRPFDPAALRAALTQRLEDYMLPRRMFQREALPRAENGKLQRKLLR